MGFAELSETTKVVATIITTFVATASLIMLLLLPVLSTNTAKIEALVQSNSKELGAQELRIARLETQVAQFREVQIRIEETVKRIEKKIDEMH